MQNRVNPSVSLSTQEIDTIKERASALLLLLPHFAQTCVPYIKSQQGDTHIVEFCSGYASALQLLLLNPTIPFEKVTYYPIDINPHIALTMHYAWAYIKEVWSTHKLPVAPYNPENLYINNISLFDPHLPDIIRPYINHPDSCAVYVTIDGILCHDRLHECLRHISTCMKQGEKLFVYFLNQPRIDTILIYSNIFQHEIQEIYQLLHSCLLLPHFHRDMARTSYICIPIDTLFEYIKVPRKYKRLFGTYAHYITASRTQVAHSDVNGTPFRPSDTDYYTAIARLLFDGTVTYKDTVTELPSIPLDHIYGMVGMIMCSLCTCDNSILLKVEEPTFNAPVGTCCIALTKQEQEITLSY